MDFIFGDLYGEHIQCYLDNIIIFGNEIDEVLHYFEMVLQKCVNSGIAVKLEKMKFLTDNIQVLGHIVNKQGIGPNPKKVEALLQCRPPQSKAEIRSFLGMVGYLRSFIPRFAEYAFPLSEILKKGCEFRFEGLQHKCFEFLRQSLADQVLLAGPRGAGPFVIVADASAIGIGSALLQLQDKELVLLEFASRKLSATERRWDTREREAFAIKWSCERFQDYLKGHHAIIYTDHDSLKWMDSAPSGKYIAGLYSYSSLTLKYEPSRVMLILWPTG